MTGKRAAEEDCQGQQASGGRGSKQARKAAEAGDDEGLLPGVLASVQVQLRTWWCFCAACITAYQWHVCAFEMRMGVTGHQELVF